MIKKLEYSHLKEVHSRRYLQICDLVNELTGFESEEYSYVDREDRAWKLLLRFCKAKKVYGCVQEIEKFSDSEISSFFISDYAENQPTILKKLKSWFNR